jgi:probable HAF family extracellular repeat protein
LHVASQPALSTTRERAVTVTDLGVPGVATAVAASGHIAGFAYFGATPHAVIWNRGVLTDLGIVGGELSYAMGVTERGQIVGWRLDRWDRANAVLWQDGVPTLLPPLVAGGQTFANAINAAGDVVGRSETVSAVHATLWRDGEIIDLGTLGGVSSFAFGINARGQVVGASVIPGADMLQHAFLWEGGIMHDLGTPSGAYSDANAINARGQVVGSVTSGGVKHAVMWYRGVMTDLGTLGGTNSVALGINARGQVVGSSLTSSGESHGFLWEEGVMMDLGTLGGRLSSASAISDSGLIVGEAAPSDTPYTGHAAVWTVK